MDGQPVGSQVGPSAGSAGKDEALNIHLDVRRWLPVVEKLPTQLGRCIV